MKLDALSVSESRRYEFFLVGKDEFSLGQTCLSSNRTVELVIVTTQAV